VRAIDDVLRLTSFVCLVVHPQSNQVFLLILEPVPSGLRVAIHIRVRVLYLVFILLDQFC